MSDKWTGRQKGDAEFMPKPAEPAPKPDKPIPPEKRKSVQDGWEPVPESILRSRGIDYRYYDPRRDLDMRPRYAPRYDMGTATEQREMRRDWERKNGPHERALKEAIDRDIRDRMDMLYSNKMIFAHQGKVIAQRIIVFGDGDAELFRLDIPTERQAKLAELFEKTAQVPGYAHWWAESDPARMVQTQEAAREIAGALRWDADYWRPAYPAEYDLAAWLSHGVATMEVKRIKVETVREPGGGIINNLGCVT